MMAAQFTMMGAPSVNERALLSIAREQETKNDIEHAPGFREASRPFPQVSGRKACSTIVIGHFGSPLRKLSQALFSRTSLLGVVAALGAMSCSSTVSGTGSVEEEDAPVDSVGGSRGDAEPSETDGTSSDDEESSSEDTPGVSLCDDLIADYEVTCNSRGNETVTANDTWSPGCQRFENLSLEGGTVTVQTDPFGAPAIILADTLTIAMGAEIDLSGQGYLGGIGPGKGLPGAPRSSGAGHGGKGGDTAVQGGRSYGDPEFPTTAGSGGGGPGGKGGGALFLCVGNELVVDGSIRTEGGDINPGTAGGGAGGSLLLIAPTIRGEGELSARGGDALSTLCSGAGASGGGGRIALLTEADDFDGSLDASSGAGCSVGEDGTIHRGGLPR